MIFYNTLITWYLANKRDLPWRKTTNPYYIWLSEIILQQTRVLQGLPYYNAFLEQFPKVSDLANARQEDVLKLWQGLGYYSRARNLHLTAQHVSWTLNDTFPDNYNDLIKLKGIGTYTAAAIASFAFNEKVAVVDGNVFRVLSRIFNIEDDISLGKTKKIFQELANNLLLEQENSDSALFNQAIMDFGATQCVPKSPNCKICPFNASCLAFIRNKVSSLPIKNTKIKITNRFFDYVLIKGSNNKFELHRREVLDIWQGLFEFNLIESLTEVSLIDMELKIKEKYAYLNPNLIHSYYIDYQLHKLSHQHLKIRFWLLETDQPIKGFFKHEIENYAFPIVIANFFKKNYDKF